MTTGILAIIIFAAIVVQVTIIMLISLYRRRKQFRAGASALSGMQPSATPDVPATAEANAWKGFRQFVVQRRKLEDAQGSICSFYLAPADGKPLPPFKPGQFLTFKLDIEAPAPQAGKSVIRCYSLSDSPDPNHYRVSIKRVPAPADRPELPAGVSSNYFHDRVTEGTHLQVRAPSGHFHLIQESALPVVLIGGGIGITPMLSILNTLLQTGSQREIWLFYGIRNGSEQIMREQLLSLAEKHRHFHLHCCYSNPTANDVEGIDFQHRGRVDIPLLRATLPLTRHQFYICGPKSMMESLVPGLEAWGVQSSDIYYESFGPATLIRHDKPETDNPEVADNNITVTFSKSGKQIPWDWNSGSLLEFAETQGIDVDSGCRAGSCGSCQTAIESGEVEYNQQADADVQPGHCLLCITRPKNNLTLAA